ncbi:MAG: homocysteine S-methyltransferase [Chloroflexota bacterium]|nr:homocysteine S-methyltransferase [Chloroflexota bacterium]
MTAGSIRSPFPADEVTVLDGGLATELERRGHDLSDPLWSARLLIEAPEEIAAAHLAYFRAGARVVTSASYQASFEGFAARGIDRVGTIELLRRSVELAAEARRRHQAATSGPDDGPESALLVAASVGPYGAILADGSEYRGDYGLTVAELAAWHGPRLAVLADAGPDLLAIETIPSVDEGRALVELLASGPGPPAWLSFTCADGARTRHGEPVETAFALAELTDRVVAIGINCTAPEHAEELVRRARAVTARAIVAYPNSGETWDARTRRWTGLIGPNVDSASARRWVAAGARLIGGCCRVGPDRIADLAAASLG